MDKKNIKEFSLKWNEILSSQDISEKTIQFGDLQFYKNTLYWTESRPWEKGRSFLVSYHDQKIKDETNNTFHVSTSVHGYGGGAFLAAENALYFFDSLRKQIMKKNLTEQSIESLTNTEGFSYGDFSIDDQQKYLYCIRVNYNVSKHFPSTDVVRINLESKKIEILFSGEDFYSNVRVHPDGKKILFLSWNQPHMPWDENKLWVAEFDESNQLKQSRVIFHENNVSVYQPEWNENKIYASINRENLSKIVIFDEEKIITISKSNFDFSRPLWIAGTKTYGFISKNEMIATGTENGIWKTVHINLITGTEQEISNKLSCINQLATSEKQIAYFGGNDLEALSLYVTNLHPTSVKSEHDKVTTIRQTLNKFKLTKTEISKCVPIEFSVIDKNNTSRKVYANYYPQSENKSAISNPPPCIIKIHGGPTSQADCILNPKIQFYTIRGFAYVELNYSGSSGFGKEYRNRLNGNWGIIDVDDTIACTEYLIQNKLAHENKCILMGGSAGGFTLLNTLCQSNLFACASCHYGVADLIELSQQIHKFEASYDQSLIGFDIKSNPEIYKQRSPIYKADKIKTPIIFFHGDKDPVVPMSQSISMAEALKNQNVTQELLIFPDEGHGFKKEETIVTLLDQEIKFFLKFI